MSDLITRKDAIKAIEDRRCWLTLASQRGDMGRVLWDEYYIKFEDAIDALLLIPSADRPKGEWIEINIYDYKARCSCCGVWSPIMGNFCPNCGAQMKGADDEAD